MWNERAGPFARGAFLAAAVASTTNARAEGPLAAPPDRVIGLVQAQDSAARRQPAVRQAQAATAAAAAQVEQARSGYLPQVTLNATYQRTTGNFAPRPGALPGTLGSASSSFATFNFWNFNAGATQLIYDFGQTDGRWRAASANEESFRASERTSLNGALLGVRTAFFQARAQKALVKVAEETLTNQRDHLVQVEGQYKVGQRAEIDVVQARTNVANAKVTLTNARNAYEIAKSQLNQAMGVEGDTDFEVAEDELGPIEGEDQPARYLVAKALMTRPEIAAYAWQYESQLRTIRSLKGGYGPTISASTTATESGVELSSLVPNWAGGATVTWPIFQGGLTRGQVHEAEANLDGISAQTAAERLQIGVDVNQGRSAVRAAKENISATDEALTNAREQLLLAERRYATGLGNIIELSDAQVAVTSAAAQSVQAHFNLSTGRAQLLNALGGR